jgi:hypothetical protein
VARTCTGCSLPLNADDAFCGNCGRSVPPGDATSAETDARRRIPEPRSVAASWPADDSTRVGQPPFDTGDEGDQERPGRGRAWSLNYDELSEEPTFDPLANSRFLWQVVRQGALYVALYLLAEIVIGIFCLILAIAGVGFASAFNIWGILGTLVWIALVFLYWLLPIPALLAQHSQLLRLSARAAPTMLDDINQTFLRHATPSDSLGTRSMSPPGEGRREYLELRRGPFSGIVSCFPHGADLYVGWTFWIYLSPLRLMLMFIGRKVQNRTGRGNDMYQTLRYDSTRATIAAIHSSVLEVTEKVSGTQEPAAPAADAARADPIPPPTAPGRAREFPDRIRERAHADSGEEPYAEG